jgi:hypothetical protein
MNQCNFLLWDTILLYYNQELDILIYLINSHIFCFLNSLLNTLCQIYDHSLMYITRLLNVHHNKSNKEKSFIILPNFLEYSPHWSIILLKLLNYLHYQIMSLYLHKELVISISSRYTILYLYIQIIKIPNRYYTINVHIKTV